MKSSLLTYFVIFNIIVWHGVLSHNWLDWPVSRANQRATQTGCRVGGEGNPDCPGPCDLPLAQANIAPIAIQRGQALIIDWNRHTHPGGFIRFAWSSTALSDDPSQFDNHVDRIVCKDIGGCGPADPSDPTGDNNGLDCTTTITVPDYLTDGKWTLQWAYFGGWYNAGDYYACVDYTVSGGPTGTQQPAFFIGGDFSNPGTDVCQFYSTNALHVCVIEPCTTGTFSPGAHNGQPAGINTVTIPPPPVSLTTKKTVQTPATTAAPKPATTRAGSTTKQFVPLTTAAAGKATTGKKKGSTTTTTTTTSTTGQINSPSPTPSSDPSSPYTTISPGQSCDNPGYEVCASANTYLSCYRATVNSNQWSAPRPCQPGLVCKPWLDNNHVICDWPPTPAPT